MNKGGKFLEKLWNSKALKKQYLSFNRNSYSSQYEL